MTSGCSWISMQQVLMSPIAWVGNWGTEQQPHSWPLVEADHSASEETPPRYPNRPGMVSKWTLSARGNIACPRSQETVLAISLWKQWYRHSLQCTGQPPPQPRPIQPHCWLCRSWGPVCGVQSSDVIGKNWWVRLARLTLWGVKLGLKRVWGRERGILDWICPL